jgi:hypothetical protein
VDLGRSFTGMLGDYNEKFTKERMASLTENL